MPDSHEHVKALRSQYERITPPAALEARLAAAMAKQNNVRALWGRYFIRAVLAAALTLSVAANVSAAAADTLAKIPVIGAFTQLVTFRNYTDSRGNMEARIETPHVEGLDSAALEKRLNEQFDQYGDALAARYEADVKAFGGQGHESVYSTYDAPVDNQRQLTVAMHTVLTQASAMEMNKYYTIDKRTGKLLELKDLFLPKAGYVSVISANILEQMKAQMEQDSERIYFVESGEPTAFKAIRPDQEFYVNQQGKLVIAFDKYEVAPGYMGAVSFEIPTEILTGLVDPSGLLGQ